MAKKHKKPESELDLEEAPLEDEAALVEDDEPAVVEDDEPAVVEDDEPAVVAEDDDADAVASLDDDDIDAALGAADDDLEPVGAATTKGKTGLGAGAASTKGKTGLVAGAASTKAKTGLGSPDAPPDIDAAEFEDPEPEPGMTVLTGLLLILNLVAALAFVYVLVLDYAARYKIQQGVIARMLHKDGLPPTEKDKTGEKDERYDPAVNTTRSYAPLTHEQLKAEYEKRRGFAVKEEFQPVFGENLRLHVRAADLTPEFLKDYFKEVGEPVKTLEEEIKRLRPKLPTDIAEAAKDAGKKEIEAGKDVNKKDQAEKNKRKLLVRMLMPLARSTDQVTALDRKIASVQGEALDKFLVAAAHRRMLADILTPLDDFRPETPDSDKARKELAREDEAEKKDDADKDKQEKKDDPPKQDSSEPKASSGQNRYDLIERLVELTETKVDGKAALEFAVTIEQLEKLLDQRLEEADTRETIWGGMKRQSFEKREHLAFLLLVINQVVRPDEEANPPAVKKKDKADGDDAAEPGDGPNYLYPKGMVRVQLLVGQRDYTQACDTLSVLVTKDERRIVTAIERDRGHYVYPVYKGRLVMPNVNDVLVKRLEKLLRTMKINIPDDNDFKKQVGDFLVEQNKVQAENPDKGPDLEELVKGVADVLTKANVVAGDAVQKATLNRELFRLLDPREQGFVGRYQDVVRRIRDIAEVIKDREERLKEVTAQEKARGKLFGDRTEYADVLLAKVIVSRAETKRLADNLRELQEQLFRAQLELAYVEEQNQAMERLIRVLERNYYKTGKGAKQ